MRRIIPARAGFTIVDYLVENRERDHPRSRGVYYATYTGSSVACGSSPLARGLPRDTRPVVSSPGIIPARAGFTTRVTARIQFGPDHPRSRGVYRRGILPLRPRRRIIPARAGFTQVHVDGEAVAYGSSPLARGLPSQYNPVSLGTKDHPRSRGVYHMRVRRQMRRGGSSPLARGLRSIVRSGREPHRIIPARAGFTCCPPGRSPSTPDHPRSRGVYDRSRRNPCRRRGSSPLARGLHGVPVHGEFRGRIIPARAGFTIFLEGLNAAHRGSSPLARGLPDDGEVVMRDRRIIPARAGFTLLSMAFPYTVKDHPRSRGVYPEDLVLFTTPEGSSPLARGLPFSEARLEFEDRIIPARAGFTARKIHRIATGRGSSPLARGLLSIALP